MQQRDREHDTERLALPMHLKNSLVIVAAAFIFAPTLASADTVSPVPAVNAAVKAHGMITTTFPLGDGVIDTVYADGTYAVTYPFGEGGYDTVFSDGKFAIAYPMAGGGFDTVYSDGSSLITPPR
jgi:hypothetical protein